MQREPLRPIDFRMLKEQVPIERVLELIGWQPVVKRGPELRGPCPVHKSKSEGSQTFAVNTDKNGFKCFKCGESGNQLDLAAHHFGIEKGQVVRASVRLCRELGIEIPRT